MTDKSIFVGYGSLEEMLKGLLRGTTVYANHVSISNGIGQHGVRTYELIIMVSRHCPDMNQVHYCRMVLGHLQYMGKTPISEDPNGKRERAQQAWKIVEEWLIEQEFYVAHAMVAMPKDLVLFDGWADFLGYDKEEKQYFRKDQTEGVQS